MNSKVPILILLTLNGLTSIVDAGHIKQPKHHAIIAPKPHHTELVVDDSDAKTSNTDDDKTEIVKEDDDGSISISSSGNARHHGVAVEKHVENEAFSDADGKKDVKLKHSESENTQIFDENVVSNAKIQIKSIQKTTQKPDKTKKQMHYLKKKKNQHFKKKQHHDPKSRHNKDKCNNQSNPKVTHRSLKINQIIEFLRQINDPNLCTGQTFQKYGCHHLFDKCFKERKVSPCIRLVDCTLSVAQKCPNLSKLVSRSKT